MQLRQSERRKAKIKMALQGSAGAGKTYSSLLLAQGLTNGDLSKVAIIDTENGSADLYAHLGNYNVLTLTPPFTPDNYIKAIDVCEKAGIEVIIIDSISHCWDYLLDYHSSLAGNSFTNWAKIKPLEKAFMDKILQCDAHVIATMRTKQDYVLNQKDGKFIPEKVGLKAVQRDGLDYEFTIVFDVDIKHFAVSSKDRTGLFMGKPEFVINSTTGRKILEWCNSGTNLQDAREKIKATKTVEDLKVLYNQYSNWRELLEYDFKLQKDTINSKEILLNPKTFSTNGSTSHH
ncbi:AAA family ATPase [Flavobacterium covae]|uniref:AAA family ATPase n=1 Tax=Flavobacterium covae TaxID=2906076 RepID=UPI000745BBAA|nr:AAA family ATPase [Flavobacterium covae]AMA49986.1 AAA family ATPase [Flavobacterium covae]MCJ1808606.1 ATP-binding protein [Flavobacterium covae]